MSEGEEAMAPLVVINEGIGVSLPPESIRSAYLYPLREASDAWARFSRLWSRCLRKSVRQVERVCKASLE